MLLLMNRGNQTGVLEDLQTAVLRVLLCLDLVQTEVLLQVGGELGRGEGGGS